MDPGATGGPGAPAAGRRRTIRKTILRGVLALSGLYLLLLIPDPTPVPPRPANRSPFGWNRDQHWKDLEARFAADRAGDSRAVRETLRASLERGAQLVARLDTRRCSPDDPIFAEIEENLFALGPLVAATPDQLPAYMGLVTSMRDAVKGQSTGWDMNADASRNRMYRLLYGGRMALEEAMLQAPPSAVPAISSGPEEPSPTPSVLVRGVRVHSGDILLSRGGAPTSALIARGSDYPGNFSHVALVHVDVSTAKVSILEAHIEKGVAVATIEEYLRDTKVRVMALRLRADLPALAADPLLPHKAASLALGEVAARHIPYDFAMDFEDHSRLFCSEVASAAYRKTGVTLWMGLSSISSAGLCSWLSAFGVTHTLTQEPSDLEYDPQLRVVAEWRDPDTLLKDHLDNAVTDVLLEAAERGETLTYSWPLLPMARALKGYSGVANLLGSTGPIPEGMSATAALKSREFHRRHGAIGALLQDRVREFKAGRGYVPPYWEILKLAREAQAILEPGR